MNTYGNEIDKLEAKAIEHAKELMPWEQLQSGALLKNYRPNLIQPSIEQVLIFLKK